ncbi:MAG: YXWGXW repeat-containing protein [Alphaproteobacteria bacterium]|nr:YXWGXW repeat-containing protein [Alphaproteobacteria bacterium]
MRRSEWLGPLALFASLAASSAADAGISLVITAPRTPPPALRAEHHGGQPFKNAVWIDGRWDWRDGQYVWISGHWERAPGGQTRWQPGRWSKRGLYWFFAPGKWL